MEIIPVGQNCHLGAALSRYGFFESSLFKWTAISAERLAEWLRGGASLFSGPVAYRVQGTGLGTLDRGALLKHLPDLPADVRVNTIVQDLEPGCFIHGVQLTHSQAATWSEAAVAESNHEKIQRLERRFLSALAGENALLMRLHYDPAPTARGLESLISAAQRLNPSCRFAIFTVGEPDLTPEHNVAIFRLESRLPPGSDLMNVETTFPEFERIFQRLGIPQRGIPKDFVFDN